MYSRSCCSSWLCVSTVTWYGCDPGRLSHAQLAGAHNCTGQAPGERSAFPTARGRGLPPRRARDAPGRGRNGPAKSAQTASRAGEGRVAPAGGARSPGSYLLPPHPAVLRASGKRARRGAHPLCAPQRLLPRRRGQRIGGRIGACQETEWGWRLVSLPLGS